MHRISLSNIKKGDNKVLQTNYMPLREDFKKNWILYLMAMPALITILIFGYGPLFGLSIAFFDYTPVRGLINSTFVGIKNFQTAFSNPFFWKALQNTIIIKGLQTIIGFPSAIILALLLNEIRLRWFKSMVQTATMLPYFISWIVVATMFFNLLTPTNGLINEILQHVFGLSQPITFLSDPNWFRWVIVLQDTWKFCGFFAVIYLAAIANINPVLYEAAKVDGANRFQLALHVTLPGIRTTIITLFILLIGYLTIGSFEQIFAQYNVSVYSTSDILETLTYRLGLQQGEYGYATAVGLFQSVISLGLILFANFITRKSGKEGIF